MAEPHGNREAHSSNATRSSARRLQSRGTAPIIVRIPIPVRLPHDVVAWLDQLAEQQSEPRSVVIRHLLRSAMERQQRSREHLPVVTDGD